MPLEVLLLFALISVMVWLFMTEKLPLELTAALGLLALIFGGLLSAEEAFFGLASPAVITLLSIFVLGAALRLTGVADLAGRLIYSLVGNREILLLVAVMLAAGLTSAFMNNIAATAVLMPTVASLARRSEIHPSRLYLPLAVGAILGGTLTLVGTPPNIFAAEMLSRHGLRPFGLFDFTLPGGVLLLAGIAFMVVVGRRLLRVSGPNPLASQARELARAYQLEEQIFSIRIPENSQLDGMTMAQSRLGPALDVQVLAIIRRGQKILSPDSRALLRGGDTLIVEGRLENLQELFRVQGVEVFKAEAGRLPRPTRGFSGLRLKLQPGCPLLGRSLQELQFRERLGAIVVGILRGDALIRSRLRDQKLMEGDRILVVGSRTQLALLGDLPGTAIEASGLSALQPIQHLLYFIRVSSESPLVGSTLGSSRIGELAGVTIGGLVRGGQTRLAVEPGEEIQAGDRLLMVGEPSKVLDLLEIGNVQLEPVSENVTLESDEIGIVEAVVAPRSALADKSPAQLSFRDRYGLQIVSIWSDGRLYHGNLAHLNLRVGDALLLQGDWERIRLLASDPDFLLLSQKLQPPRRSEKAPMALLGLGLMVIGIVSGIYPPHIAAFTAATLVLLTGALTMEEAYRYIDWRTLFLVAAMLPIGIAMEQSGGAALVAHSVTQAAWPFGPWALLTALTVLSSLLSQALDGAPVVVLLSPIAIQTALQTGVSPYPLVMGVALGASIVFLTPFGSKASLLVMSAGGYQAGDIFRLGAPLTLLLLVLLILVIPRILPF